MFFEERYRFLNLMLSGDYQLIKRELEYPGNMLTDKGADIRNLLWLVLKINKLRPKGDRKHLIYQ